MWRSNSTEGSLVEWWAIGPPSTRCKLRTRATWVGLDSSYIVPKLKRALRHIYLISTKQLTKGLRRLNLWR
ncbi:hypothetical protein B296_00027893 [Ensete ventricosum]|uniref:Uncharacterized protein n=1 Tax=Ensete ventricosum TaxID=4639 RepID=A0A426ZU54_ENSVE|nr:hypothetical protein B296_00027893 [Ensete ventricosum]